MSAKRKPGRKKAGIDEKVIVQFEITKREVRAAQRVTDAELRGDGCDGADWEVRAQVVKDLCTKFDETYS